MPDDVEKPAPKTSARAGPFDQPDAAVRGAALSLGVLFSAFQSMAMPGAAGAEAAAAAAVEHADSLRATSEVPWNPPRAMPRRNGWERAVLLPGRLVSLPLAGLGYVTDHTLLRLERRPRLTTPLSEQSQGSKRTLDVGLAKLGDRTGLGGAVALRRNLLQGALASDVAAEYSASVRHYNRTRLTWSGRPMALQYGYEWRPEEGYYGVGNGTSADSLSDYAGQDEFVRATASWRPGGERSRTRPHLEVVLWAGPHSRVTRTGRESDRMSYETRYPALGNATLNRRVENLVYGVQLLQDHRSGVPHWSRGWRALFSAERFDAPIDALALHSGSDDGAQFTRFQAEAEAGVSIMRDPRTLRVLVRLADQDAGGTAARMLPADYSTLGGHRGLGGYFPGRFHDMDLLHTRVAYVFPLGRFFETDLHSEWGAVYANVWRDARPNTLHHSFGFALRVRDASQSRFSIGMDFSREAARVRYTLGGAE